MYNCKNCGGNLRFDIPTQQLRCPYCDSNYDCYEIEKENASADDSSYDVTVFSCPQCGGEIVSTDQSASEFCSYCGSSVVLNARLRREKRPQKIIPFQKTARDCQDAYKSKLRGAIFAPGILKDPRFLENFRGIYIPYWSYSFSHRGNVSLTGKHEYRSGDYDVTDYYNITGDVNAHYDGICYDASSSFDDAISEAIAPFDPKQMKDFVPSYLSGFYADVADVPADTYQDEANNMANEETMRIIEGDPVAGRYPISRASGVKAMNQKLKTVAAEPVGAMLPVWFLTWRDQNRVAYMTVNGQTGKVSADIPIDIRKYIFASLICAVPLYFVLNALFSFTAPTSLFFAGLFALASGIIYYEEVLSILKRDTRELDRGFQHAKKEELKRRTVLERQKRTESVTEKYSKKNRELQKKQRQKQKKKNSRQTRKTPLTHTIIHTGTVGSLVLLVLSVFVYYTSTDDILGALINRNTLNFLLMSGVFGLWEIILFDGEEKNRIHKPHRGIIGSQLAAVLAAVINIIHPVSDVIYYIGMIIAYLGIFSTLVRVTKKYNLLITRPIPELHNRGKESL